MRKEEAKKRLDEAMRILLEHSRYMEKRVEHWESRSWIGKIFHRHPFNDQEQEIVRALIFRSRQAMDDYNRAL